LRLSSLAAISGTLQPADHEIHETLHACVTEDAGTAERAEVVDDVESLVAALGVAAKALEASR
jgi:hypothetical protein